jgi:hypothetical protein
MYSSMGASAAAETGASALADLVGRRLRRPGRLFRFLRGFFGRCPCRFFGRLPGRELGGELRRLRRRRLLRGLLGFPQRFFRRGLLRRRTG